VTDESPRPRLRRSTPAPTEIQISRVRRVAFIVWVGLATVMIGIGFFGLTSLVIAWFGSNQGVANPVTDLGYGALIGILITGGLLVQLRAPERKIAGLQQAALAALALLISDPLAGDNQNLVPGLIVLATVGIAVVLHPARREFLAGGPGFSAGLAAIALLCAGPLLAYALSMSEQARELSGPPHHIQRLTTMAAMAIAVGLVGVLAALQTRGWRISAWCVGAAAMVLGLSFVVFPSYRGSAGGGWGVFAVGSGLLYIVVAERRAERVRRERQPG
jgi:hypothetical protein